jgi:hypothetical protein
MENKQTAVEWFAERIQSNKIFNFENVLKQAKQMEKEQIIDAHGVKSRGGFRAHGEFFQETKTGEEYYNEKYANDTTKGLPEEDSKRRAWHY